MAPIRKTLIITNSYDGTVDLLVEHLGSEGIFRLNFDLWQDYKIDISKNGFLVCSPVLELRSEDVAKVYWRKPFHAIANEDSSTEAAFLQHEAKSVLRDLYSLLELSHRAILTSPWASQRLGKLVQADIAAPFFRIPVWRFTKGMKPSGTGASVVKSLSSAMVDPERVLFTTRIEPEKLDSSYPWLLQELVDANFDVTVVYAYERLFAYGLDRSHFVGLDWRRNAYQTSDKWFSINLPDLVRDSICRFMRACRLDFGRLDFLALSDNFLDLYFLEVNSNGQWAWLDLKRRNGLLDFMLDLINPDKPMPDSCDSNRSLLRTLGDFR